MPLGGRMDLSFELGIAQKIAREAGAIALSKQSTLKVRYKPHGQGPVSDADILVDEFLCCELKRHFPEDQIISEESYQNELISTSERVWLLDPIDGTASFILGRPDFVVMVGLLIDQKPVLGVIYQPATDIMWSGVNFRAHKLCERMHGGEKKSLHIQRIAKDGTSLRILVSPHTRSKRQSELIDHIQPASITRKSSIGLKAMLVTDNEADFYVCWNRRMKVWDTCAPQAIINASGALMCHLDGSALRFNEVTHASSIMVANFEPQPGFRELLRQLAQE